MLPSRRVQVGVDNGQGGRGDEGLRPPPLSITSNNALAGPRGGGSTATVAPSPGGGMKMMGQVRRLESDRR